MTPEFLTQRLLEASQQRKVCKLKMLNELVVRIVNPYGICLTRQKKIVIVCWQEEGPDLTRHASGYRNLSLENCQGVEVLEKTYTVRQDFNPEDPMYKDWVFHI